MKDLYMVSLMFHFKIDSIDGRIFGILFCTEDGIKLGIIEWTDVDSLIYSSEICVNNKLDGSLDDISQRCNCTCKAWWFTWCNVTGTRIWMYRSLQLESKYGKLDGGDNG